MVQRPFRHGHSKQAAALPGPMGSARAQIIGELERIVVAEMDDPNCVALCCSSSTAQARELLATSKGMSKY
jgi:hypothetical protein